MTIDTDVHCAPGSLSELLEHMDPYWREYATDANLALSPSQGGAYPPGSPVAATPTARAAGVVPPADVESLRARVLDDGADLAVLNCLSAFDVSRNPYYEAELARAVNEWVRTRMLDQEPRLRAGIAVPTQDPDAAVAEIARLGRDPRFVQVLLPVRGQDARYGHLRYRPILRAAAEHGLAVCLHAWGRAASGPTYTGALHTYAEDYLSNTQIVQGQVVSLIVEGVFDELPELRVCLAECGFSWVPSLLWRFDKEWKGVWREVPWVRARPSEYFYRHFRATTQPAHLPPDAGQAAEALEMLRARELLMYASDHPHDHGDGARRLFAALDDAAAETVRHGNASEFYALTP